MTKAQFLKQTGLTKAQFNGKKEIKGYLDLSGLTSIPEGFNPTVGGYLDLSGLTSIPEGFNPTVGGYLYLRGLTSIPEGFNPTVGGYLDLRGLTSIPEGFNPTVGGSLYLSGLTSIPEGFNPTVGGSLDLSGLTSIPEGFNPTVGGYLYLSGLTSIPEGFNPTVGGSLYLSGLTSIPEGFNPTVGGSLYLRGGSININANVEIQSNFIWEKYSKKFALIDGFFSEILSEKTKTVNGNKITVFESRKIASKDITFIVKKDNVYAHGTTFKSAFSDLLFKFEIEKFKSDPITKDTLLTVKHYRAITGACDLGVRSWMESNGIPFKVDGDKTIEVSPIKAGKLLPLLEKTNAYGYERIVKLMKQD